MSKLDEIEEIVNTPGEPWPNMHEDLRLLIRTVRQLGAIVRERESRSITLNRIEHGSLDPDVLELLESEK